MIKEIKAEAEIIDHGRLAYEQGFISGASGNLSIRLDEKRILVTASGVHKGRLSKEDLILFDIQESRTIGAALQKPSSEIRMHAAVYHNREDVHAVIHAHPPYAVALSVVGMSLAEVVLPEAVLAIGPIVDCGYATPATEGVVKVLQPAIKNGHNAIVLKRHGSVTLGKTMVEAFNRLETLEHVAKVTAIAKSIGKVTGLPDNEVSKLLQLIS